MEGIGGPQSLRERNPFDVIPGGGDPGRVGGGTYTNPRGDGNRDPTIQDYENIFGPAARDIKQDLQRNKRHARWHLPDVLRGSNTYLADRIDGLITDTTSSPFTTVLLPYKYIENVDQKIKWNAVSFDEGLASRVPYESAARTLTQTKRSYAGYTVRHGLAMTMEHNFMMSEKGRENFKRSLQQVVGSIQYTNDLDVHIALITAVSYAKERAEKYYTTSKTNHQIIREYIDLFGFMSKNPNAMDIMIEDAREILRTWGAQEPNFLLTNSKLTFQMTMIPEKTQYLTQGPDGVRKLREGPNISSYRGLRIINTRAFSMEEGAPPRDVLRRRVRVAEYYRIPWDPQVHTKSFAFYDEAKDAWQKFTWHDLRRMAQVGELDDNDGQRDWDDDDENDEYGGPMFEHRVTKLPTYGVLNMSVDWFMDRELFRHMTCGEIQRVAGVPDGWELEQNGRGGNLALNPWYALCGINAGNGSQVPTLAVNVGAAPAFTRDEAALHLRRSAAGGPPPPNPLPGSDYLLVTKASEYMFTDFAKILKAFGYEGEMNFTRKSEQATRHFADAASALGGGAAWHAAFNGNRAGYADGTVPLQHNGVRDAVNNDQDETFYNNILNGADCNGSRRGHPDYSHWSYAQARRNFHLFLRLYLQGKADALNPVARTFFDQFNWQAFDAPGGNRLGVFSALLQRVYDTTRPPFDPLGRGGGGPMAPVGIQNHVKAVPDRRVELVVVRPNIEHNMLGIIMGRGGLDELGATFWGQTELSCYDDSMHGIWGMSYKYNEKAIVLNHKNLIRLWDVAYDGYNGGKDCTHVSWTDPASVAKFKEDTYETNKPYEGVSMMVMAFENVESGDPWPSPIIFHDPGYKNSGATIAVDGENAHFIKIDPFRVFNRSYYQTTYKNYIGLMPDFSKMHNTKGAGNASEENESQSCALAFQGTMKIYSDGPGGNASVMEISGSGHHGNDYVGVASVRAGKGMRMGPVSDTNVIKIM